MSEHGREICQGRKVHGHRVEIIHYFEGGDPISTFHTDVADNCLGRKMLERPEMIEVDGKPLTIKELVAQFGKDTFIFLSPEGIPTVAKTRTQAARDYGYNGNGHTVPFLNKKGCRSLDGQKIRG